MSIRQWQKFWVSYSSYIFQEFVHVHMSMAKVSGIFLLVIFFKLCSCPYVNGEGFWCLTLLIVLYSSSLCPCQCIYDHGDRSISLFIFVHVSLCLYERGWQCSACFSFCSFSKFNYNTHGVLILHIQQVMCLLFI